MTEHLRELERAAIADPSDERAAAALERERQRRGLSMRGRPFIDGQIAFLELIEYVNRALARNWALLR